MTTSFNLFLDSTHFLTVGLLDQRYNWIDYVTIPSLKTSGSLHRNIHDLLEKHGRSLTDIKELFWIAGPGSYTGMRLTAGLAQMFEWQNITTYSFYHFEVPHLLGQAQGHWITKAFKGEYFKYIWRENKEENTQLVDEETIAKEQDFFYLDESLVPFSTPNFKKEHSSVYLIKDQASKLFPLVKTSKMKRSPFYFRPDDVEFKRLR